MSAEERARLLLREVGLHLVALHVVRDLGLRRCTLCRHEWPAHEDAAHHPECLIARTERAAAGPPTDTESG